MKAIPTMVLTSTMMMPFLDMYYLMKTRLCSAPGAAGQCTATLTWQERVINVCSRVKNERPEAIAAVQRGGGNSYIYRVFKEQV